MSTGTKIHVTSNIMKLYKSVSLQLVFSMGIYFHVSFNARMFQCKFESVIQTGLNASVSIVCYHSIMNIVLHPHL